SGLARTSPEAPPASSDGIYSNSLPRDRISKVTHDDLWSDRLKRPIQYLRDVSREKYGWEYVVEGEWDLISRLTNPGDIRNRGVPGLPTQRQVTRDQLYDVVPPSYLSRLVQKWIQKGYVFKKGRQLVANREWFEWGEYPGKPAPVPVPPLEASQHHFEFWLEPRGFGKQYARYYDALGSKTIGARNAGEKRVINQKLRLFGINVLHVRDYCVYAYPRKGIKCNAFIDGYTRKDDLEAREAGYKRTIEKIIEEDVQERIHETVIMTITDSTRVPHTTIPGDQDMILPDPRGKQVIFKAEGPGASHPGQAESTDREAREAVNYTNSLNERTNALEKGVHDLQQDMNRRIEESKNMMNVLREHGETMKEIAQELLVQGKVMKESNSAILSQLTLLTGQLGTLVQTLLQRGAGEI
ncbi:MAG: hypothetical protein Q6365_021315, partial [Candidatus Sigynarchaeota archaeon]